MKIISWIQYWKYFQVTDKNKTQVSNEEMKMGRRASTFFLTEVINQKRGEERGENCDSWTQREQKHPARTSTVLWSLMVIRFTGVWIKHKVESALWVYCYDSDIRKNLARFLCIVTDSCIAQPGYLIISNKYTLILNKLRRTEALTWQKKMTPFPLLSVLPGEVLSIVGTILTLYYLFQTTEAPFQHCL